MAIDIDGFAVLGAIARAPEAFPVIWPEVGKAAKGFVGKQLKDKGLTPEALQAVVRAIGVEAFDLIADAMSDAEVKALLAKVDRHNAAIRSAPASAQRQRLSDLADGRATPADAVAATKPPKAPKPAAADKPAVERSGNSKAMRAKRKTVT